MERSNQHCFHSGHGGNLSINEIKNHDGYKALLKRPCRIIVVSDQYNECAKVVVNNLSIDGFVADLIESSGTINKEKKILQSATTSVGKSLETVRCVMKKVQHCLHRGGVYAKQAGGKSAL